MEILERAKSQAARQSINRAVGEVDAAVNQRLDQWYVDGFTGIDCVSAQRVWLCWRGGGREGDGLSTFPGVLYTCL